MKMTFGEYLAEVEGELGFDIPVAHDEYFLFRYKDGLTPLEAVDLYLENEFTEWTE